MAQDVAAMTDRFTEVKSELAARCYDDSDFREALINDPNGTLEEEYGLEKGALAEFEFEIITEEGKKIVIVVPPDTSEMELSDDELDQVAGGGFFTVGLTIAVIGASASVLTTAAVVTQNTRAGRRW
jgi:hypothetical protein